MQDTVDKTTDSDGIHPCILKKLGPNAIQVLKQLFNLVLQSGDWVWTTSQVIFIRKPGKATYTKASSFRPLTLSSYFGKVLERIMDLRIRQHILNDGLVDDDQEGFITGRSTTRYLFRLLATLNEIKRQKLACIILFIDFEKAFDSICIKSMTVKLQQFGITGLI